MSARGYQALRQELKPDERLIWSGYPRRDVHLPIPPVFLIVIAPIVVLIILVLTALTVWLIRNPNLAGIIFLTIAWVVVYAVVFERFVDTLRRRSTIYGLTDRRAIVIAGIVRPSARSVQLDSLIEIDVIERPGQIGTLRCISVPNDWYRKNRRGEIKPIPLFRAIVDPRHVHDLLLEANSGLLTRRRASSIRDLDNPESHVRIHKGPLT